MQFNCLYRWHATTSQKDEKWVEDMGKNLFGDKPVEEVGASNMSRVQSEFDECTSSQSKTSAVWRKR